eukprot:5225946-Amphidinium_carterae.1
MKKALYGLRTSPKQWQIEGDDPWGVLGLSAMLVAFELLLISGKMASAAVAPAAVLEARWGTSAV